MIKKTSAALVLVSSIILAGCSLLPASTQTKDDQAKQAEKLAKIMEKGGQAVCEISQVDTEEKYTITVKGKKMKMAGITMDQKGKVGYMINDTVYTYIWAEGTKEGFKTKISAEEVTPAKNQPIIAQNDYQPEKVASEYEDETKYKVNCKEGNVPESEFVPPSDVKFIDPTDYLKNIPTLPADYNSPSE